MQRILNTLRGFDRVLEVAPVEGSGFPEIAWGDHFFYFAPDGQVPQREQPFATLITKNYPGDSSSDLDPPGRWRLNVHIGRDELTRLLEGESVGLRTRQNAGTADLLLPHPVYARQGWVAIVNPAERTETTAMTLLRQAYEAARRRVSRRNDRDIGD